MYTAGSALGYGKDPTLKKRGWGTRKSGDAGLKPGGYIKGNGRLEAGATKAKADLSSCA